MTLDLLLAKAWASRTLLLRALVVRARVARTGHPLPAPNQAAPAVVWTIATFGRVISVHM